MSFRGKKQSPFRFAELSNYPNDTYRVANLATPSATSCSMSAGAKFFAVPHGKGGDIMIAPVAFQDYNRSDKPLTIKGFGSNPTDVQFSPHNDLLLAACGQTVVKTFLIPAEGLTENLTEAVCEIKGLQPPQCMAWHPSASDILAVGAKNALYVLDMGAGEILYEFKHPGYGKDVVSVAWNSDGSLLAAGDKSGKLSVGDPRTAGDNFMSNAEAMSGFKGLQHVMFVGSKVCMIGPNKYRKPTVAFFDPELLDDALAKHTLVLSSGYVLPFYDPDSKLLLITVRGSSSINTYDVTENKSGCPRFTEVTSAKLAAGAKGGCFMSKRGCDADNAEIQRLYVLASNGIYPHGLKVPRKSKGLDPKLFPPTADVLPALSATEWNGGANKAPTRIDMEAPLVNCSWSSQERKVIETVVEEAPETASSIYQASEGRKALDDKFKVSIYRHLKPKEPETSDQKSYWFDLKVGANIAMSQNIKCNSKYFACTCPTGGGSAVYIKSFSSAKGRTPTKPKFMRGLKSQVTTFDLSNLTPDLLLSGNAEGRMLLQQIPEGGLKADCKDILSEVKVGGNIVRVWFHPYIADVRVCSYVPAGDELGTLAFYGEDDQVKEIEFFDTAVEDVSFHPNCRLVAAYTKDGKCRVVDIIDGRVIKCFKPVEQRMVSVFFFSETKVITVGFGPKSIRSWSLWDVSGDGEATKLCVEELGRDTAAPVPYYDMERKILIVGHFGIRSVNIFHLKDAAPFYEGFPMLNCGSDIRGWCFNHPAQVDVKAVEIARSVRISKGQVVPQSWTLPRRRKEFFQDDLFPDVVPCESLVTADQFFNDFPEEFQVKKVSMCPKGMTNLSDAPEEALTARQLKYKAQRIKIDTPDDTKERSAKVTEEILNTAAAITKNAKYTNRWDAQQASDDEVDSDEWGSDPSDSD